MGGNFRGRTDEGKVMKLVTTIDLDGLWDSDGNSIADDIKREIRHSIERAVQKHVNEAVKDILGDYHKEIKAAARAYAVKVVEGMKK